MESVQSKVREAIARFSLFPENSKILVALSGGPDSVTLLHTLLSLKEEMNLTVGAVHVNHMLRGEESDRDEAFVREICKNWNVPLIVKRVNVPEISKGRNVEAVARRERYRLFREALSEWNGDYIALGHTASDLTETVLLNLTKGSGIKGLRGFLPKREVFVRPLFLVTREEVEAYVEENRLPFVVDSSNLKTDYDRNLIRLEVVPVLKRINPALEEAVLRETALLREFEDFVKSQVEPVVSEYLKGGSFCAPVKVLRELPSFLLSEVLREAYRRVSGKDLSYKSVEKLKEVLKKSGFKKFSFHKGTVVYKTQEALCIEPEKDKCQKGFYYEVRELPSSLETPLYILKFSVNSGLPVVPLSHFHSAGIIVRSRKPGDRLKFKGFSKPLKKFLIEKRFPAHLRNLVPVVEFNGEVVFIPELYTRRAETEGDFVGVEFERRAKSSDKREGDKETG